MHFIPKTHSKFLKGLIFILEKGTFFTTISGRGQNMVRVKKWAFFGLEISVFGPKIDQKQGREKCKIRLLQQNGHMVLLRFF